MNLCRAQSSLERLSRETHETDARVRESDRELDCDARLICDGPDEKVVDDRPSRVSVSTAGSSSAEFGSAVGRLFVGCMLEINIPEHTRLTLGKRKVSYGVIQIATYPCLLS